MLYLHISGLEPTMALNTQIRSPSAHYQLSEKRVLEEEDSDAWLQPYESSNPALGLWWSALLASGLGPGRLPGYPAALCSSASCKANEYSNLCLPQNVGKG